MAGARSAGLQHAGGCQGDHGRLGVNESNCTDIAEESPASGRPWITDCFTVASGLSVPRASPENGVSSKSSQGDATYIKSFDRIWEWHCCVLDVTRFTLRPLQRSQLFAQQGQNIHGELESAIFKNFHNFSLFVNYKSKSHISNSKKLVNQRNFVIACQYQFLKSWLKITIIVART